MWCVCVSVQYVVCVSKIMMEHVSMCVCVFSNVTTGCVRVFVVDEMRSVLLLNYSLRDCWDSWIMTTVNPVTTKDH